MRCLLRPASIRRTFIRTGATRFVAKKTPGKGSVHLSVNILHRASFPREWKCSPASVENWRGS